jgi:hypothetical protein
MLHDLVDDPAAHTVQELLAVHATRLADAIETVGVERAAAAVDLQAATLERLVESDADAAGDLAFETAAAIIALDADSESAQDIAAAARDALLFGMTTGVLNVDVVAGEAPVDIEPREVQGMVEGRHPMTLREYVALQRVIAGRGP